MKIFKSKYYKKHIEHNTKHIDEVKDKLKQECGEIIVTRILLTIAYTAFSLCSLFFFELHTALFLIGSNIFVWPAMLWWNSIDILRIEN